MLKVTLAVLLLIVGLVIIAYRGFTVKGYLIKLIIKKQTKKFTRERLNGLMKGIVHLAKNGPRGVKRTKHETGDEAA